VAFDDTVWDQFSLPIGPFFHNKKGRDPENPSTDPVV
jgi:hypothetical protein